MTIYVVYLLIVVCTQLLCEKVYGQTEDLNKRNKTTVVVAFLGVMIIACFRDFCIGADTKSYLNALSYFKSYPQNEVMGSVVPWYIDFESGYLFVTKLAAWIRMDDRLFISLMALVIFIPTFRYIQKYSDNVFVSLLVYFSFSLFAYSISLFRQMIAISICLCSIKFIFERKAIKFFILILMASLFHTTAFCWLPLYFLYSLRIRKEYVFFVLGFSVFGLVFSKQLLSLILTVFPKYAGYGDRNLVGGTYMMLICLLVVVSVAFFFLSENKNIRPIDRLSILAISVGAFLQSIAYSFGLLGRIIPYYSIFLLVLIPRIYSRVCAGKERVVFKWMIVIGLLLLTFVRIKGDEYIYPYQFMTF